MADQDPFAPYAAKDDPFAAYAVATKPDPQRVSVLEMGRRSANSGNEEGLPTGRLARLNEMLEPVAHPKTAGDMAALAIPGSGELAIGARALTRGILRPVAEAGVRGVAALADVVSPEAVGLWNATWGNRLRMAQKARDAMNVAGKAGEAVAETTPAAAPHLDRSVPVKAGDLTRDQLAERILQGHGEPTPVPPNYAPRPTPSSVPSPLKGPRIQQGAERVGRAEGLTKEQVRTQTGPIVGENLGEASPILPHDALTRIVDTMKALPQSEREAYVLRATAGKTRGQVENIRRTLEHLGLLVPLAAAPVVGKLRQTDQQ